MRKDRPWLLALTLADLACGLSLVSGGSCLVLVHGARSPAVDTSERGPALVMDPLVLAWPTYVLPGAFLAASGLALLAQALVLAVALWPDCGCGGRCGGGRCGGGRCCVFQRPRRELRDMAIDRGVVYRGTEQRRRPHSPSSSGSSSSSDSAMVVVVRTIATQTDENQEEEKEEEKTPPPPATRKKAKKKRGRRMEDRSEDDEEFALFSESEGSDQEDGGFFRYLW